MAKEFIDDYQEYSNYDDNYGDNLENDYEGLLNEPQGAYDKAIVEDIEKNYKFITEAYTSGERHYFERKIINLFKRTISELADKDSKEIRKKVKEEVIERAEDKLMLDKNEVVKRILLKVIKI